MIAATYIMFFVHHVVEDNYCIGLSVNRVHFWHPVAEVDATLIALEEWLIIGEIVYHLAWCGLDHCIHIVDKSHDEFRQTVTHQSRNDQIEGMSEGQHDDDDNLRQCHRSRRAGW